MKTLNVCNAPPQTPGGGSSVISAWAAQGKTTGIESDGGLGISPIKVVLQDE